MLQLSIVAKNIPKLFNDKGMLKIHFSKFGKVTRLFHNENKNGAIITYDDPVNLLLFHDKKSLIN